MIINECDAVRFYHDPNIYEVTRVYKESGELYYSDPITGQEHLKDFEDVENIWSKAIATHVISGCYFPQTNEIEATWECLETNKKVSVTFTISEGKGEDFTEVMLPCVYHLGAIEAKP